jgi:hypothetical protein
MPGQNMSPPPALARGSMGSWSPPIPMGGVANPSSMMPGRPSSPVPGSQPSFAPGSNPMPGITQPSTGQAPNTNPLLPPQGSPGVPGGPMMSPMRLPNQSPV